MVGDPGVGDRVVLLAKPGHVSWVGVEAHAGAIVGEQIDRDQPEERGIAIALRSEERSVGSNAGATAKATARAGIRPARAVGRIRVGLGEPVVDLPAAVAGELAVTYEPDSVGFRLPDEVAADAGTRRRAGHVMHTGLASLPPHAVHTLPFIVLHLPPSRCLPLRHDFRTRQSLLGRRDCRYRCRGMLRDVMRKKCNGAIQARQGPPTIFL